MQFAEAAKRQYRYQTCYTVYLVGPDGEREYLGYTSRKSGQGLLTVLRRADVQEQLAQLPNAQATAITKRADRLLFSNGWRMEFGGTIRQEAE